MKTIALFAASAAVIGLCACTPPTDKYGHWGKQAKPMKTVSKLACPDEKGQLKRTSVAPDGRSCMYSADDGSTVELRLVQVNAEDTKAALAPIEANLRALVPVNEDADEVQDDADSAQAAATVSGTTASASAKASADGAAAAAGPVAVSMHPAGGKLPNGRSGDEDEVHINLPGIHINAGDDKANVRIAGFHIDADDKNDDVHVEKTGGRVGLGGNFTVDAHDGGAVIRSERNDANIRSTFIIASDDDGPAGKKAAGYVARGPRTGPLVVAVIQVTDDHHDHHDSVFNDATRLVKDNTGE
jgi:hypothetical protein